MDETPKIITCLGGGMLRLIARMLPAKGVRPVA